MGRSGSEHTAAPAADQRGAPLWRRLAVLSLPLPLQQGSSGQHAHAPHWEGDHLHHTQAGKSLVPFKGPGSATQQQEKRALSRAERERLAKQEFRAVANEELSRLWMYRDKQVKARAKDYFEMLKDPKWRLVSDKDGTEVWRLPGEKIHRIMGVAEVNKPPTHCMQFFKDPRKVFTNLFPKIDTMFVGGKVLEADEQRGYALCQGVFRLPMPIGNGAARGVPPRDMVWEQLVGKLPTGNVLVTAKSVNSSVPPKPGAVRGEILTSGYYGRAIGDSGSSGLGMRGGSGKKGRSKVWYIVQADPCGCLPKWLVNLASTKQASNVTRLAKLFEH